MENDFKYRSIFKANYEYVSISFYEHVDPYIFIYYNFKHRNYFRSCFIFSFVDRSFVQPTTSLFESLLERNADQMTTICNDSKISLECSVHFSPHCPQYSCDFGNFNSVDEKIKFSLEKYEFTNVL